MKPHFYIVKLGFAGVYIFFLISAKNKDCGYSLEPPRRGGSNEYRQSMYWAEIWKYQNFYLETFSLLMVKFSIFLNRRVDVMVLIRLWGCVDWSESSLGAHVRRYGHSDSRPRWLSWMRRPTGDQEVAGSTPAEVGNILSWRLMMKYFLRSFSPFRWFKKGSCQFLAKECAQYWSTA